MFRGTERGAATASLLADIVNQAVAALPIAKRMRWGARSAEFVRPVHAVVLLYGETVVAGRSVGTADRAGDLAAIAFMRPSPFRSSRAKGYESRLRRAKVVADFATRRELIRAGRERGGGRTARAARR